jgi:hypothetical protein
MALLLSKSTHGSTHSAQNAESFDPSTGETARTNMHHTDEYSDNTQRQQPRHLGIAAQWLKATQSILGTGKRRPDFLDPSAKLLIVLLMSSPASLRSSTTGFAIKAVGTCLFNSIS